MKIKIDHSITIVIILFIIILFTSVQLFSQTTFIVTNTNNDGEGSLEKAINDANSNTGLDVIEFSIPGDGPHVIILNSELPQITDPIEIKGYSQNGAIKASKTTTAKLMIALDGNNTGQDAYGIIIKADNCTIEGLAIYNFGRGGIFLGSSGNKLKGNYIGVSIDGSESKGNGYRSSNGYEYDGVWISNSANNIIGGIEPSDRNIISCNAYSNIYITGNEALNNKIYGNYIGSDATGTSLLENQSIGIECNDGKQNYFGGPDKGMGNLISGNGYYGLVIYNDQGSNFIQGNMIGVDISGTVPLRNEKSGIYIQYSDNNLIGGIESGMMNIISGNGFNGNNGGVIIYDSQNIKLQGNYIGSDITGTKAIPNNYYGAALVGVTNSEVGSKLNSGYNLVSGNNNRGILLVEATKNNISGNYIGIDINGEESLANKSDGIEIRGSSNNIIGSIEPQGGNIISGNNGNGILIKYAESEKNQIIGNIIGMNYNNEHFLPNDFNGVEIRGGSFNIIGGKNIEERNIIAGNGSNGVLIRSNSSSETQLLNIDELSLENLITAYINSPISSSKRDKTLKLIKQEWNSVVSVKENIDAVLSLSDSGNYNSIYGNSIFGNKILGIDLLETNRENDDEDVDEGSNRGQNYPIIESVNGDGTNATIVYNVNSSPENSKYPLHIEFFIADTAGQGKTYIGSDEYLETDARTNKSFVFAPSINIGEGEYIVTTATDSTGNTSEFSDSYTTTSVVGIQSKIENLNSFKLKQNYPNPFNPNTKINYSINAVMFVSLNVYDVLGREIANLVNQNQKPGDYSITFNAENLTSGIYYYTLETGNIIQTRKMILIK